MPEPVVGGGPAEGQVGRLQRLRAVPRQCHLGNGSNKIQRGDVRVIEPYGAKASSAATESPEEREATKYDLMIQSEHDPDVTANSILV